LAGWIDGRKPFFFEKKNQKTFVNLDHACETARRQIHESFLLLFFKKEVLTSFLLRPARHITGR
jgi:hypothetical protein